MDQGIAARETLGRFAGSDIDCAQQTEKTRQMVVLVIEMQLSSGAVGLVGFRRVRIMFVRMMVVRVRILMVAKMRCLPLVVRAIVHGRSRRPGDLEGQQGEQKQDQPATHGRSLSLRDFGNKQNRGSNRAYRPLWVTVPMMRIGKMRMLVR